MQRGGSHNSICLPNYIHSYELLYCNDIVSSMSILYVNIFDAGESSSIFQNSRQTFEKEGA